MRLCSMVELWTSKAVPSPLVGGSRRTNFGHCGFWPQGVSGSKFSLCLRLWHNRAVWRWVHINYSWVKMKLMFVHTSNVCYIIYLFHFSQQSLGKGPQSFVSFHNSIVCLAKRWVMSTLNTHLLFLYSPAVLSPIIFPLNSFSLSKGVSVVIHCIKLVDVSWSIRTDWKPIQAAIFERLNRHWWYNNT